MGPEIMTAKDQEESRERGGGEAGAGARENPLGEGAN